MYTLVTALPWALPLANCVTTSLPLHGGYVLLGDSVPMLMPIATCSDSKACRASHAAAHAV